MAIQIYSKEFCASRSASCCSHEREEDVREKALKDINEFFLKHDSFGVVNIIENWSENKDSLKLVVYYEGCV